ncbi:uncharacterized protein FOMMEDRAFT_153522 [Fomitiporia mediterranea MF3/22]|uniref:uncharacterized protein n=1 Tax=Fomitiporia mediterranea (strain MF3/22) TaxID=694068 RepID=UPI0004408D46|nr:uncharacterized protein FOMMEDRAFT_153522 [Fomitiporia mediterranea MF3/22]EJD06142.1 hypothetical protein FOMMEDRAFT_153522 [Fomitiporia mediterranea MF3/22]
MTWEDDFRRSCALFQQRKHEAALKPFNKAARENKTNSSIFYLRSLVLRWLGRYLESLRDVQKAIDLMPESESWKAYRHSAAILLQIGRLEESLKMVDLALERADENAKKIAKIVELREQIVKALEPRACHFSKLPVEINTEIFALVIDGDNANMLALTLVCRAWRDIINGSSRFWRKLVVTPKTRRKQADTWLQRSGGTLTTLLITGGLSCSARPGIFREAEPTIWSELNTLKFTSQKSYDISSLPHGAADQLKLVKLELLIGKLTNGTLQALNRMDKSRLKELVLRSESTVLPTIDLFLPFPSLTTLELCFPFSAKYTLSFLKGTPMLQCLILTSPWCGYFSVEQIDPVELVHLRHLMLNYFWYTNECLQYIHSPNVRLLTIRHVRKKALAIPQYLTKLERLCLECCILPTADFVSLLRLAASLQVLQIPRCSFHGGNENAVVRALPRPIPTEEKQCASRMLCCPKLQCVVLSGLHCLKADPVVELVKARLPSARSSDSELLSPCSPKESPVIPLHIVFLNLDGCPIFDPSALLWLKAAVSCFSYRR